MRLSAEDESPEMWLEALTVEDCESGAWLDAEAGRPWNGCIAALWRRRF
jgi:hypothetical protein